jgi:hypothetical protein
VKQPDHPTLYFVWCEKGLPSIKPPFASSSTAISKSKPVHPPAPQVKKVPVAIPTPVETIDFDFEFTIDDALALLAPFSMCDLDFSQSSDWIF